MAKVATLKEFEESTKEFVAKNPDLIPLLCDAGYGMHYAPSKKNPNFRLGDVRLPASALKEEYRHDLAKIRDINVKVIAFIPKSMAADEILKLLEDEPKEENKNGEGK